MDYFITSSFQQVLHGKSLLGGSEGRCLQIGSHWPSKNPCQERGRGWACLRVGVHLAALLGSPPAGPSWGAVGWGGAGVTAGTRKGPQGPPPGPSSHFCRLEKRPPLISSGLGSCRGKRLELPPSSHGAQDGPGRVKRARGQAQGPLLHPPSWPSLPAASRVWVSRQGVGSQGGGGGPAGQPCVCATAAPAGLASWLSSSQTAPQNPGSPEGRLSPEGWSAAQGPGGSWVGQWAQVSERTVGGFRGGSLVKGEAARETGW